MAPIEFRVLGPVEAWSAGKPVDLGHAKQRSVLAVLLVEAGRVVRLDQLIDRVWGGDPPPTARNTIYGYITRLRSTMAVDHGGPDEPVLRHRAGGYCLDVGTDLIDLHRFRRLVADARAAGSPDRRIRLLRSAIDLWYGPAFADMTSWWLRGIAQVAEDELWTARLEEAEARLQSGGDAEVLDALRGLVAQRPLDERLVGLLMLASYRRGSQADALDWFHGLRRGLDEELGVSPGAALARLYQQILRNDPELLTTVADRVETRPATRPVPAQLPHDVADFTGRDAELDRLRAVLAEGSDARDAAVPIIAVDGTAGVGKTALALHFAHRVADRFPDGQLYVDLRGYDPRLPPLTTPEVLGQFLRALGTNPHRVPTDPAEQAALFRTLLRGKRLLLVLDNATDSGQVRPLIPGHPGSLVIVTSRNRLAGLAARDGALRLTLDVLSPACARELLSAAIGDERPRAEPEAVDDLGRLCGLLPLALRIAAERAAVQPELPLRALTAELAAEQRRLDLLAADDETTAVRAVFSWSYRALDPAAARAFRLLGLHAGPSFSGEAAAALIGLPRPEAAQLLAILRQVHLLEMDRDGRHHCHDLLRIYAAEQAAAEQSQEERAAATRRSLAWYLHTADAADRMLIPQRQRVPLEPVQSPAEPHTFAGYEEALAWCEAERANLVAAARLAAQSGQDALAWRLPAALWGYFTLRKPWAEWFTANRVGLEAARRVGDRLGEAYMLGSLGFAHWDLRQHGQAVDCFQRALTLCRELGHNWGQGIAMLGLGLAHWDLHEHDEAIGWYLEASRIWNEIGDLWTEAHTLNNLGNAYRQLARHTDALNCFRRAVDVFKQSHDRWGESWALHNVADTHLDLGDHAGAGDNYRQAIALRREIGDRHGEGESLYGLGRALYETNQVTTAGEHWHDALAIFEELGDLSRSAEVHARLAEIGRG